MDIFDLVAAVIGLLSQFARNRFVRRWSQLHLPHVMARIAWGIRPTPLLLAITKMERAFLRSVRSSPRSDRQELRRQSAELISTLYQCGPIQILKMPAV